MTDVLAATTDLPQSLPDTLSSQRPWGQFDQYTVNEQTTVKIISVDPGARLSMQRHAHRAERWLVLDGPVDVEIDERSWTAAHGEVVWVPLGAVHRMGNSGTARVRILEIAYGVFDEDDIERLQDDYQR